MIKNAYIENFYFIYENRRLCFFITTNDGCYVQTINKCSWQDETDSDEFGNLEKFIFAICECLEINNLNQLSNLPIRIEHNEATGMAEKILRIGHYLKDQWVTIDEWVSI